MELGLTCLPASPGVMLWLLVGAGDDEGTWGWWLCCQLVPVLFLVVFILIILIHIHIFFIVVVVGGGDCSNVVVIVVVIIVGVYVVLSQCLQAFKGAKGRRRLSRRISSLLN